MRLGMRILIYNEKFSPSVGGSETMVRLIAQSLHEHGEEVVVATETPASGEDLFPFPVVRQPSKQTLARLVSESDLVHLHSFHPSLFLQTQLKRKKTVYTYHDLTLICPKGTKLKVDGPCLHRAGPRLCHKCLRDSGSEKVWRRLIRPVAKSILSVFIDANVCSSYFGMRRFRLWRKQLILYGINTSLFRPHATTDNGRLARVVFVGRLIPEKGCRVLIDALRLCVERGLPFDLDIAGYGPELSNLLALAGSYDLQGLVHFRGIAEGPALVEIMQKADVAVVPSIWDEPFGLVAIEAFSCGLPVIAADVGGLGQVVSQAGLTFQRGDAKELATHLERLLTDHPLRQRLGRKARQMAVQKYDYRMMAATYHRLFRQLHNN